MWIGDWTPASVRPRTLSESLTLSISHAPPFPSAPVVLQPNPKSYIPPHILRTLFPLPSPSSPPDTFPPASPPPQTKQPTRSNNFPFIISRPSGHSLQHQHNHSHHPYSNFSPRRVSTPHIVYTQIQMPDNHNNQEEEDDDDCGCGITGNIGNTDWDSMSRQLQTVFLFIQGLREANFEMVEETLSEDYTMEILPRSLGIPMRKKGEWLRTCKESNVLEPGYRVRSFVLFPLFARPPTISAFHSSSHSMFFGHCSVGRVKGGADD